MFNCNYLIKSCVRLCNYIYIYIYIFYWFSKTRCLQILTSETIPSPVWSVEILYYLSIKRPHTIFWEYLHHVCKSPLFFGLWGSKFWNICTDISKEPTASIILMMKCINHQDDGVCIYIHKYAYLHRYMHSYIPACIYKYIIQMVEAGGSSETLSVHIYHPVWCHVPYHSNLHSHCCGYLNLMLYFEGNLFLVNSFATELHSSMLGLQ